MSVEAYLRVMAISFEVALADFLAVVRFLFVYPASEGRFRVSTMTWGGASTLQDMQTRDAMLVLTEVQSY